MNWAGRSCVRVISFVSLLGCLVAPATLHAQQGGVIWLDYAGGNSPLATAAANPQGAFNLATLQGYTGLATATAANLTTIQNDITQAVQNAYSGQSLFFTSTKPTAGPFSTIVIGTVPTAAGARPNILGSGDEIDWRNLDFNNTVGVNINPAVLNVGTDPGGKAITYAFNSYGITDPLATSLANTTVHEIGHVLGLEHLDSVGTYFNSIGGGSTAKQAQTAVQLIDPMGYNTNYQNETNILQFNSWEKKKLDAASHGIQLENEQATITAGFPGLTAANDALARAGDAGNTIATGTALKFQNSVVDVLGALNATTDKDDFTFMGQKGQVISAEVLSSALSFITGQIGGTQLTGPHIANNIGTVSLSLLAASPPGADQVTQASNFPLVANDGSGPVGAGTTDYDGFVGMNGPRSTVSAGNGLIYNFYIPATGLYAFQVGGTATGQYELFVAIPEPATLCLILPLGLILLRRRPTKIPGQMV